MESTTRMLPAAAARCVLAICLWIVGAFPLAAQSETQEPSSNELESPSIELTSEERAFLDRKGILFFAADPDWAPLSFRSAEGAYFGMQADILQRVSQRLDVKIERPSFNSWPEIVEAVSRSEVDFRSGDSEESLSTIPYLSIPLVLVTPKTNQRDFSFARFRNRSVSLSQSNAFGQRIIERYPNIHFVLVENELEGISLVHSGKVDAHVGNYAICTNLIKRRFTASLSIIDTLADFQNLSFVVAPNSDAKLLIGILNKAINSISTQETNDIFDKWIQVEVRRVNNLATWWKPIAATAFLLLLALLWRINTLRLRRALVEANERSILANKAGAGGQFEWYPRKGKVTYSPEFFKILGYEPDELEQSEKTVIQLAHPEDQARALSRQSVFIRRGQEYEQKLRMRRKDGSWAWIVMRGVPTHHYPDGSTERYIGVQMDVTELQETNEKLRVQQEISRKANRAKTEFLANMSHEIRTPMNAILGFSRLLKRDPNLSSQQREYIQLINSSSEHLLSLLDDILDMSKIESGKMTALQFNVDLPKALKEIAGVFKARCSEKGIAFTFTQSQELPSRIQIDGTKLRQICYNLLVNAVKFTESGGVEFNVSSRDQVLLIQVKDTGVGISEEELSHLFRPFNQGEAGQKQSKGTGLGLAISKEFCKLMGGDLTAQSQVGIGTEFEATLPYMTLDDQATESDAYTLKIPFHAAARKRLLVVDDKLYNIQYLERFLSEYGFQILLAQSGASAIAQWKLYSPDLILLDIRMPEMDGYQVVELIRSDKIFHQPKIIALTASAFKSQVDRILSLGADRFMTKPFDEDELLSTIAELLSLPTEKLPIEPLEPESQGHIPEFTTIELQADFCDSLIAACEGGYVDRIEDIIASVEETQPEAAQFLSRLAKDFEYERIAQIVSSSPSSTSE